MCKFATLVPPSIIMLILLNQKLILFAGTFGDYRIPRYNRTSERRYMPPIFPFTAIVGQERMRRALILNAVDTRIGGVLIRGERGTAKSTASRALAALLPSVKVVDDCRFGCDPDKPSTWCTEC